MKFYLSGGMEFQEGLGKDWREYITKELIPLGHYVFDPFKSGHTDTLETEVEYLKETKYNNIEKYKDIVRRHMFAKDIKGIQESDSLILLYDRSVQLGAGTLAEAWEAFREAKPVYIVSQFDVSHIPGWLIAESTAIFSSFERLLEYLKDEVLLENDAKEAVVIRDKYLGGVYKN